MVTIVHYTFHKALIPHIIVDRPLVDLVVDYPAVPLFWSRCFQCSPGRGLSLSFSFFSRPMFMPARIHFVSIQFVSIQNLNSSSTVTSSVTYCEPPETLLVQRFQVAFYPRTQTVAFNLSAASVVRFATRALSDEANSLLSKPMSTSQLTSS